MIEPLLGKHPAGCSGRLRTLSTCSKLRLRSRLDGSVRRNEVVIIRDARIFVKMIDHAV